MIDKQLRKAGFRHPCKGQCSGYQQGYDDGVAETIEQLPAIAASGKDYFTPIVALASALTGIIIILAYKLVMQ